MLDAAVAASGMSTLFDAVLSVDMVRAYKPRPEVYALVTKRFGIAPRETVFVSSNRWDVMGAAAVGFRPIWVNRARMPEEYMIGEDKEQPAVREAPDLSGLPALL
jgi:2-haloacid dehalogenase